MLVERWRGAFPDMELRIADLVVEGDLAGWRVEGSGTHTGPLASPMGELPATGKRVRVTGIDFGRIGDDGRAVEHWSGPDIGMMMADLGLAPPVEAPPGPDRPGPTSGEAMGIPATGRPIDVYSHEFGRLADDGRAAEHWTSMDTISFMTQLAVVGANA